MTTFYLHAKLHTPNLNRTIILITKPRRSEKFAQAPCILRKMTKIFRAYTAHSVFINTIHLHAKFHISGYKETITLMNCKRPKKFAPPPCLHSTKHDLNKSYILLEYRHTSLQDPQLRCHNTHSHAAMLQVVTEVASNGITH
jgi:hypothetical protein